MLCEIGGQIIFPETFFDDLSSLPTLGKRDRSYGVSHVNKVQTKFLHQ
ncbi:MAG: hypothetical protein ACRDBG_17390 [Waterburya sp.]